MVYGVCRILLRDPQDAEDASQQTFLSAHRSLLAGTRPQDPAAWLGTIARNECRERIRSRATVPLALVGDPAASMQLEDVTGRREEIEALCAALADLPHQQREALVLREFYGLSYDEVRAALGVTDSAVESLIFRARKRLQKELRPARMASGALVLSDRSSRLSRARGPGVCGRTPSRDPGETRRGSAGGQARRSDAHRRGCRGDGRDNRRTAPPRVCGRARDRGEDTVSAVSFRWRCRPRLDPGHSERSRNGSFALT
jgi:RNA polymerase sigma factor (sigma-70 family)